MFGADVGTQQSTVRPSASLPKNVLFDLRKMKRTLLEEKSSRTVNRMRQNCGEKQSSNERRC